MPFFPSTHLASGFLLDARSLPSTSRFGRPLAGLFLLFLSVVLLVPSSKAQLQKNDLTFRVGGTASFPTNPSTLSDQYSFGRGLNVGLGVYLTPSFDLQVGFEYSRYLLDDPSSVNRDFYLGERFPISPSTSPLVPDGADIGIPQNPSLSQLGIISGGDVTRSTFSLGIKWTLSRGNSFHTYLRGVGHISSLTRRKYVVGERPIPQGDLSPDIRTAAASQLQRDLDRFAGEITKIATGFSTGLGFLFPIGYTGAIFAEPSYTVHYADLQTVQAFDIRVGFILGEF